MSEYLGTEEVANEVEQINSDIPNIEGTPHTIQGCRTLGLTNHPHKLMRASEQDGVQLNISSTAESYLQNT